MSRGKNLVVCEAHIVDGDGLARIDVEIGMCADETIGNGRNDFVGDELGDPTSIAEIFVLSVHAL